MRKRILFNRWFGLVGLLGFLAFVPKFNGNPNWFFLMFFAFFSAPLWEKIENEKEDERLQENIQKAQNLLSLYFILLVFAILFMLDRSIKSDTVLLIGSLFYAASFFIKPLLILYFEKE